MTTDRHPPDSIRETSFWQAYQGLRYAILFYTLLLTLLVTPIVTTFGLPGLLTRLLLGACLLAAVMPSATRRTRQVLFAVILLLVLAQFVPEQGNLSIGAYAMGLTGLAGLVAAAGALRFAIKTETVSSETIYAVLSTYLLAGIFFGQIYWWIENIQPGSLVGPDPMTELNATYFSFVTLATLGYGDFLPRTPITRGIATFEVIGGQLYLAVLVARLIGAFASDEP